MPSLYNKNDGSLIGTIDDTDLRLLIDVLEEEDLADDDYFIDGPTIDLLERSGARESLVSMLRAVVGDSEGVDIVWKN